MKVNIWKNVDIEAEADVSLEDCIAELLNTAESDDGPTRKMAAINGATKIMEMITPEIVAKRLEKNPGALALVESRLRLWIEAINKANHDKDSELQAGIRSRKDGWG